MASIMNPDHVFYLMYEAQGGWNVRQVTKDVFKSVKPYASHYFQMDLSMPHYLVIEVKITLTGDVFEAFKHFKESFYPQWEAEILNSRHIE